MSNLRSVSKRLLASFLIAAMPLATVADDAAPAPTDPTPASSEASPAPASQLGPAPTTSGTGSSSADATALQPAGANTLQSTTGDSTGLAAPAQSQLQAPATSQDTMSLLMSEADGRTYNPNEVPEINYWDFIWFGLTLSLLITVIVFLIRDRRRFRQLEMELFGEHKPHHSHKSTAHHSH